jgi:hypothetical protein
MSVPAAVGRRLGSPTNPTTDETFADDGLNSESSGIFGSQG